MPRATRLVLPDVPHHVVQRGNRQQPVFFSDEDRRAYLALLAAACQRHDVRCLAWSLMDNQVHLILVPSSADGLRAALASVHTTYSQRVNRAQGLSGHLFQGRFASYPMDDAHLMAAVRYVENNPVAAGCVATAEDWPWSSARAHIAGQADGLTDIAALARHVPNWRAMLARGLEASDEEERISAAIKAGRPVGGAGWLIKTVGPDAASAPAKRGRPFATK